MKDGEVIRVLRFIEYEYDDVETMTADMARWTQNSPAGPKAKMRLRSSNLPPVVQPSGEWLDERPPEPQVTKYNATCPRHGLVAVSVEPGEVEGPCPAPGCPWMFGQDGRWRNTHTKADGPPPLGY